MAKGDHIRVKRMGALYYHHGIDMGDGTIIHFSGELFDDENAEVIRTPEEEFLEGNEKRIVSYEDRDDLLPIKETLKRAKANLGNKGYDLFFNNCEHFATYCKTGKKESRQVRKAATTAVTTALVAMVAVGLFIAGQRDA
ncbi:MAG: lecithin retinol acyltransferase family protein [Candidatus Hydrogenedentes bacterium]|nr:lecithin retinol acyltransferase family protein [Candidatus Hydrogenedentota bacterium]